MTATFFSNLSSFWGELNGLSWPVTVVFLSIVFRKQVVEIARAAVNFSHRVKSFAGVELLQIEQSTPQQQPITLTAVLDGDSSLQPWAHQLEAEIAQTHYGPEELRLRLIRAWAFTRRARHFDALQRGIFATQIEALKKLSEGDTTKRALTRFYEDHCAKVTATDKTSTIMDFNTWMVFLITNGLVEKKQPGSSYHLTELGKAFLSNVEETHAAFVLPF